MLCLSPMCWFYVLCGGSICAMSKFYVYVLYRPKYCPIMSIVMQGWVQDFGRGGGGGVQHN